MLTSDHTVNIKLFQKYNYLLFEPGLQQLKITATTKSLLSAFRGYSYSTCNTLLITAAMLTTQCINKITILINHKQSYSTAISGPIKESHATSYVILIAESILLKRCTTRGLALRGVQPHADLDI